MHGLWTITSVAREKREMESTESLQVFSCTQIACANEVATVKRGIITLNTSTHFTITFTSTTFHSRSASSRSVSSAQLSQHFLKPRITSLESSIQATTPQYSNCRNTPASSASLFPNSLKKDCPWEKSPKLLVSLPPACIYSLNYTVQYYIICTTPYIIRE